MRVHASLLRPKLRIVPSLAALGVSILPTTVAAQAWISDAISTFSSSPTHYQLQGVYTSETDFGPAMFFSYERSPEQTRAYAFSAGRKISDTVFGWPVETLGYFGVQQFDERGLQPDAHGVSAFVKFHTTLNLPFTRVPVRVGFGPGLSYVSRIPVAEQRDFAPASSSKLLVYLEYSVQLSMAHLFGRKPGAFSPSISDVYVGYTVIHRSSGYGLLAETGGGINYLGFGVEVKLR